LLPKSLTNLPNSRAKRLTTPKRIGPMTRQTCYSGPYRSIVGVRASPLRSSTRTTGSKLLVSSPVETIRNVSISSTKTRNPPSKKVTGSKERTRSSSSLFARMEPSSGPRLPISSMLALVSPGMASSAERGGSTFWIQKSKKTHLVSAKISLFWRRDCQ
jgi:hypothetical protein